MRSFTFASVLALAGAAFAQTAGFDPIVQPADNEVVSAGSVLDIKWQPSAEYTGGVTISLLGGATPSTLEVLNVIAANVVNSDASFNWAVGADLGNLATYGIKISWDANPSVYQYSFPFAIKAGVASTSSASSTAVVPTSASSTVVVPTSAVVPTLSSAPSSAAVVTSSPTVAPAFSHTITAIAAATVTVPCNASNSTATFAPSKTFLTVTGTAVGTGSPVGTGGVSGSTPSHIPTNPASTVAASSLALLGGLAVAFFAL